MIPEEAQRLIEIRSRLNAAIKALDEIDMEDLAGGLTNAENEQLTKAWTTLMDLRADVFKREQGARRE